MNKYDRIDFVVYDDGYRTYHLTFDGAEANELEIDLKGELFYNCEFKIIERETTLKINTLTELLEFMKKHNIQISECKIGTNYLVIGGNNDTILKEDLTSVCIYDSLHYINDWNIKNTSNFVVVKNGTIYVKKKKID